MGSAWLAFVRRHRWSASVAYSFSLFMAGLYLPYDLFVKPFRVGIAGAEEVWLGFMLTGWAAKLTEPLHWAIYGALAFGFARERPWAWTFAALYTVQVAVGSVVWVALYATYGPVGYVGTVVVVGLFLAFAWRLWTSPVRTRATHTRSDPPTAS